MNAWLCSLEQNRLEGSQSKLKKHLKHSTGDDLFKRLHEAGKGGADLDARADPHVRLLLDGHQPRQR